MTYKPRICKRCAGVMVKHPTLKLWRCKFFTCPDFDRPHHERRVERKAA